MDAPKNYSEMIYCMGCGNPLSHVNENHEPGHVYPCNLCGAGTELASVVFEDNSMYISTRSLVRIKLPPKDKNLYVPPTSGI